MGKKTDAFSVRLQKLSDDSRDNTNQLKTACDSLKKLGDAINSLEQQHTARTLEIQKQYNDDPADYEGPVERDPKLNALGNELTKLAAGLLQARKQRDAAENALAKVAKDLKDETAVFEKYINDKEKSKKFWKSKKSLPAAKEMIKCAKELIRNNEAML